MKRANNRLYGGLFVLLASGTFAASCNAILGIDPIEPDGGLGPEPRGFSGGASPGTGGAPGTANMSASVTAAHAISSGGGTPGSTSGGGMPGSTSSGGMPSSTSGPTSTSTGGSTSTSTGYPSSTSTGGPTSTSTGYPSSTSTGVTSGTMTSGPGGGPIETDLEAGVKDVLSTKDVYLEELDAKATIDGAIP